MPSSIQVDIYNPGPGTVRGNVDLALISRSFEGYQRAQPTIRLPDGQRLVAFDPLPMIFPKSWGSVTNRVYDESGQDGPLPAVLRVITEVSTRDIAVSMQYF